MADYSIQDLITTSIFSEEQIAAARELPLEEFQEKFPMDIAVGLISIMPLIKANKISFAEAKKSTPDEFENLITFTDYLPYLSEEKPEFTINEIKQLSHEQNEQLYIDEIKASVKDKKISLRTAINFTIDARNEFIKNVNEERNLASEILRSFVQEDKMTQEDAKNLSRNQRTNIESFVELIKKGIFSIQESNNLTWSEAYNIKKAIKHIEIGDQPNQLSLEFVKKISSIQLMNLETIYENYDKYKDLIGSGQNKVSLETLVNFKMGVLRLIPELHNLIGDNDINYKIPLSEIETLSRGSVDNLNRFSEFIMDKTLTIEQVKNLNEDDAWKLWLREKILKNFSKLLSIQDILALDRYQQAYLNNESIIKLITANLINIKEAMNLSKEEFKNLANPAIFYAVSKGKLTPEEAKNLKLTEDEFSYLQKNTDVIKEKIDHEIDFKDILKQLPILGLTQSILDLQTKIAEHEKETLNILSDRESAMNPRLVSSSNAHFEHTIKPHFKEKFTSYADNENKITPIEAIEKLIRKELLQQIEQNIQFEIGLNKPKNEEEKEREEKVNPIFTETLKFIEENREKLIAADPEAMARSREYLTARDVSAQVAWRAYDKDAPTRGAYSSYFVEQINPNVKQYTIGEAGSASTNEEMSQVVRERAAYYFLAANDFTDTAIKTESLKDFTFAVSGIRRDKNDNLDQVDEPACYPGNLTRLTAAGAKHPIAKMSLDNNMGEQIKNILDKEIIKAFSKTLKSLPNDEARENLLYALVTINDSTAKNIFKDPNQYKPEWLELRKEFIESLGGKEKLIEKINEALKAEDLPPLLPMDEIYIDYALANIGGNSAGLSSTCKASLQEKYNSQEAKEDVNPFALFSLEKLPPKLRPKAYSKAETAWKKHHCYEMFLPIVDQCLTENKTSISRAELRNFTEKLVNAVFEGSGSNLISHAFTVLESDSIKILNALLAKPESKKELEKAFANIPSFKGEESKPSDRLSLNKNDLKFQ